MSDKMNKKAFSKKGQAVWISWVIVILMVVIVGTIAGRYMIDKAKTDSEKIEKYALNAEECINTAISVDFICKNAKALNMTISNNGVIRVEKGLFKLYDTSGNSETRELDINLKPGQEISIEVPRARSGYEVEVTPIIEVEDIIIECRDHSLKEIDIQDC